MNDRIEALEKRLEWLEEELGLSNTIKCPHCNGTGWFVNYLPDINFIPFLSLCSFCGGSGRIEKNKRLTTSTVLWYNNHIS